MRGRGHQRSNSIFPIISRERQKDRRSKEKGLQGNKNLRTDGRHGRVYDDKVEICETRGPLEKLKLRKFENAHGNKRRRLSKSLLKNDWELLTTIRPKDRERRIAG